MTPDARYQKALKRGVNLILPVVRGVQRGELKPTPAMSLLLEGLREELKALRGAA